MPRAARLVRDITAERVPEKVTRNRSVINGSGAALLAMQRAAGNRAVATLLLQRCGPQNPNCGCSDDDTAESALPQVQRLTAEERGQDLVSPQLAGDARLQSAFDNAPVMRAGERGAAVRLVQESLVSEGHIMPRSTEATGTLDGIFGAETQSAVRDFQNAHAADGLTGSSGFADGVVGRRTLGKMDEIRGGPSPKPPDLPPCPPPLQQEKGMAGGTLRTALTPLLFAGPDAPVPIPNQTCDPDKPTPTGAACVKSKEIPANRSGIVHEPFGSVGESFEMNIEWADTPPVNRRETSFCAAACGEYRQFLKGHMRASSNRDGSGLRDVSARVFNGEKLDENTFREDGLERNPAARYGHRNEKTTMDEKYEPDRLTGSKYFGKDFPNVSIGTFADIDLTFMGKTIDTCTNAETSSDTWTVRFRGIIRP